MNALLGLLHDVTGIEGSFRIERAPTGKFNETFFVDSQELDRPLVLRVAPAEDRAAVLFYEHRMMRQEPGIHQRVRAETSMPIPEVAYFEESNERLGRDVILMERLPGEPSYRMEGSSMLTELGAKLREVHDVVLAEPGRFGYLGPHAPMAAQSTWQDAFVVMWHALLDDIERCRGVSQEELTAWRRLLEERVGCFDHFREPASLLHMDVWAENILSDERGRLTGLVDWDRAVWGDPEIEFAVLDYCGVSTESFWEGYGRRRPMDGDAQVRRIFYLLYEVLKYIVIRIARDGDRTRAAQYRDMAWQLANQI
jgi:fructosamine-3-kinase